MTPSPGQVVADTVFAVAKTSKKRITFRVTSMGGPAKVHVELDGKLISKSVQVPAATPTRASTTLTLKGVTLSFGKHEVTFHVDAGQATVTNIKVF